VVDQPEERRGYDQAGKLHQRPGYLRPGNRPFEKTMSR
jgi:hypothetical protein